MSAVDIYEDDEPEVLLSYNRKFISNLDVGNGTSPIYPGFSCAIDYRLQMLLTYFRTCVCFFLVIELDPRFKLGILSVNRGHLSYSSRAILQQQQQQLNSCLVQHNSSNRSQA